MREHPDPPGLSGCISQPVRNAVQRCAAGDLPVNVALTHIFMVAGDEEEAMQALSDELERLRQVGDIGGARYIGDAVALWRRVPQAFAATREVLRLVDHDVVATDSDAAILHWSRTFDRLALAAPDAGVALYSLGDPRLLRAATGELVDRMRDWGLLGACAVLDLGCGTGRVLRMLAPEILSGVGADISREMLHAAQRRCASRSNVWFVQPSGRDLACFADGSFDLVCAVDVFPYLVLAGTAERHLHDAARVLRPGGHLLVLNYSYRNACEQDRTEIAQLAADARLSVRRHGTRELTLWDGRAFLLQRAA